MDAVASSPGKSGCPGTAHLNFAGTALMMNRWEPGSHPGFRKKKTGFIIWGARPCRITMPLSMSRSMSFAYSPGCRPFGVVLVGCLLCGWDCSQLLDLGERDADLVGAMVSWRADELTTLRIMQQAHVNMMQFLPGCDFISDASPPDLAKSKVPPLFCNFKVSQRIR